MFVVNFVKRHKGSSECSSSSLMIFQLFAQVFYLTAKASYLIAALLMWSHAHETIARSKHAHNDDHKQKKDE